MNIQPSAYNKAFVQYLRKGTPIHLSLKADNPKEGYYIWHTVGDGRVRSRHAARDGEIFSWQNSPEGGHPGEDFGCRCWAEPYYGLVEQVANNLSSHIAGITNYLRGILSSASTWKNRHFIAHFMLGRHRPVKLEDIGHLQKIKTHYKNNYIGKFKKQMIKKSPTVKDGNFTDSFENSYSFKEVLFSHGNSTMRGEFKGKISTDNNGRRVISGVVQLQFSDVFTDPVDITETIAKVVNESRELFNLGNARVLPEDVPKIIRYFAELGGDAFPITDTWKENIFITDDKTYD